jgi:hypothetical protein
MPLKTSPRSVFFNCPFDSDYENLYLALISGTTALGLTPRCVLEIPIIHGNRISGVLGVLATLLRSRVAL